MARSEHRFNADRLTVLLGERRDDVEATGFLGVVGNAVDGAEVDLVSATAHPALAEPIAAKATAAAAKATLRKLMAVSHLWMLEASAGEALVCCQGR